MFTATNRSLTPEVSDLRKSAYSGGLDFKHQWKNRAYFMEANIVVSHVQGSKEAIKLTQENLTHLFNRVDASHLKVDPNRTSLTGTGGRFGIGKVGGQHWNYNAGFKWVSPELELNDIGFLRSADEMIQYANVRYRSIKPTGVFRDFNMRFNQFSSFDFEGNYNRMQYEVKGSASFTNNWGIDLGVAHKPRIYSNSVLRGGPRWRFSQENFQYLFVGSDRRKKLHGVIGLIHSQAKEDNFSLLKFESRLSYQPTNALNISLAPEYSISKSRTQYVTQPDESTRYVLGTIDNHTFTASVRFDYTINPNLSIQYYGQPFISRGRYTDFKYVTNPVADRLKDRFQNYDTNQISINGDNFQVDENLDGTMDYSFENPDFSYVQFNSNLVLRWEYIPGSELFLVWAQGVASSIESSNGLFEGFQTGILDERPQNIFLLKATYRFIL
jgi:hypothetical protein